MVAPLGGEFILLAGGDGFAYLYDVTGDDFVQAKQLASFAEAQGYFGPATAGPKGQYFVLNGSVLNQSLTPVRPLVAARPIAAVMTVNANTYARFTMPIRANLTAPTPDAGMF